MWDAAAGSLACMLQSTEALPPTGRPEGEDDWSIIVYIYIYLGASGRFSSSPTQYRLWQLSHAL